MSLQDWLKNDWLVVHKTSPQQIADLLGVADRDLSDCKIDGLSADWRMNIAYNAALQTATATLAAAVYRAARDPHHYRIIHSIINTYYRCHNKLIAKFNQFRKKRNIGGYERADVVSDREANEMIALAQQLREEIELWIRTNYP